MKRAILCLCVWICGWLSGTAQSRRPVLLPLPQQVAWTDETFRASEWVLSVTVDSTRTIAPIPTDEAYRLQVSHDRIAIEANTEKGVYWAKQTLRQLSERVAGEWVVAGCDITDWPAFRVRGWMQDVGRSYISLRELKREIELLSQYKINVFHWHLTENQAWRLESKRFPALNDSCHMTRMPGQYYTLEEARELVSFCKQHQVWLIPEIDMPGHSEAFRRTFGVDMQSPEGTAILKQLIAEVCENLDVPYLHIGTDEVQFTRPEFVPEMVAYIRSLGKKVISWNPGWSYQPGEIDMTQLWSYRGKAQPGIPAIDCRFHYINHFDTFADLVGLYTSRIYDQPQGSDDLAGSILALWHDRIVTPEDQMIRENAFYPNMLALAERAWLGGGFQYFDRQGTVLPTDPTDPVFRSFADFERRMLYHKARHFQGEPFAYVKQTQVRWRVTEAFPNGGDLDRSFPPEEALQPTYLYNGKEYLTQEAVGAGIYLRHVWGTLVPGLLKDPQPNHTAYAWTWVYSPQEQTVGAWIEFQNYSRSEMDLPPLQGQWDYRHSRVWVNDEEILPPVWTATHRTRTNEVPLGNENCVGRPPIPITLHKGWNKVFLKLPVGAFSTPEVRLQKWMFTFVFVTPDGENAVEDLIYSPDQSLTEVPLPTQSYSWSHLPDLPSDSQNASKGVSAPFWGLLEHQLLVAGGCNFPEKPAAEGGTKRYEEKIYRLDLEQMDGWHEMACLSQPLAYGASVETPEGLCWIGGMNGEGSSSEVRLVSLSPSHDSLHVRALPALPAPFDNGAAAYADGKLYVVGGNLAGKASRQFFQLDLTHPAAGWQSLPEVPGVACVQPVLVAQHAPEGTRLYVSGGFQPGTLQESPVIGTHLYSFLPATGEWQDAGPLPAFPNGTPRTLTGGGAVAYGDSCLLWVGGVNHDRFLAAIDRPRQLYQAQEAGDTVRVAELEQEAADYLSHPVEWYRFNRDLLCYNTFLRRWEVWGGHEPLARAGAGVLLYKNRLIVLNGELKPGIRTAGVHVLSLPGY